jgi:hypothetical protein
MKSNVGKTDRFIRLLVALAIALMGIYFKSWWGLVALLPLITGAISFCPMYKFLGLNTGSRKSVQ